MFVCWCNINLSLYVQHNVKLSEIRFLLITKAKVFIDAKYLPIATVTY
jgi:hypothetical protein